MLVTDGGREFFNSDFQRVMVSYGVNHFRTPTKTKWKASIAERAIRTIKTRIDRIMQKRKTKVWIDVLDSIVENYNNTPHSAHGLTPLQVTDENRHQVYKKLYPYSQVTVECKLRVGDRVRKIREKSEFEKGYKPNWSEQIYVISSRKQSNAVCWYTLEEHDGTKVPGIWYYYQLNFVSR